MKLKPIIATLLLITFLSLLCASCDPLLSNHGYPKKVTFSKKGGEQKYHGESIFYAFDVQNYNGTVTESALVAPQICDTSIVTCQWLTVKFVAATKEVIFIAEPNTTKKKRKLYFHGDFGPEYAETTIIQNK